LEPFISLQTHETWVYIEFSDLELSASYPTSSISSHPSPSPWTRSLCRYQSKMPRHLKKLTCKGILWKVFIRVYRLEIQSAKLVFRHSFVNCCLSPLLSGWALPPPPFPVLINILYTRIQCVCGGGGCGILGLRQINTCSKVHLQVNFVRWRHFALPSMSLFFLRIPPPPPFTECRFAFFPLQLFFSRLNFSDKSTYYLLYSLEQYIYINKYMN
jgi:hypothetical protein